MAEPLILDLEPDCATSPIRPDLAIVEAMMLWPDDEAMRETATATAMMVASRDLLRQGRLPQVWTPVLADLALDATPPAQMQEAAKARFVEGQVTGVIVYSAIAGRDFDHPHGGAMRRYIKAASKAVYPEWRLMPGTINTHVLPRFRPVAHLWAAWYCEAREQDKPLFPCRTRDLPVFLARAEWFREAGESTRLPHAPTTVLRPGEAVVIPDAVLARLPKITMNFERVAMH